MCNYVNVVCISSLLLIYNIQNCMLFALKMKLKQIYFQNFLNEIPVKYSLFNNLSFLMEYGSIELSAGQDEYFIVIMSWLFFTALFRNIYFSPHSVCSPPDRPLKQTPPKTKKRIYRETELTLSYATIQPLFRQQMIFKSNSSH